mgnify:CR=1 FL=1|tara:strand:+ start:2253 stop:2819 length:567 start_codon:yes stop_codon:yes gene_type:complete
MGKDKSVEKLIPQTNINKNDLLFKIVPLIIGLLALTSCYLLYKKINKLSTDKDEITKLQKLITDNIKEQNNINLQNNKNLNSLGAQLHRLQYFIENQPVPTPQPVPVKREQTNHIKQPVQREPMPSTTVGNLPISNNSELPQVISTTNKIEHENKVNFKSQPAGKKIIDLETLKEEVIIEEASSDDEA